MAIHKTVLYSPDRRIRITADPGGFVFTVEKDRQFIGKASSLAALADLLAKYNVSFEDLIED